jgi:hypothetical protein
MPPGARLLAMPSKIAKELADRLAAGSSSFRALRSEIEAGEPWRLSDNFGTEPEASWGPRETLAHVQEMLPFWLGEIERVIEGIGRQERVPFGRVATDEIRVAIIERDRSLPLRELFARIEVSAGRVAERLRELDDTETDAVGAHPRLGPMTVGQIAERFVCDHLEEHERVVRPGNSPDCSKGVVPKGHFD